MVDQKVEEKEDAVLKKATVNQPSAHTIVIDGSQRKRKEKSKKTAISKEATVSKQTMVSNETTVSNEAAVSKEATVGKEKVEEGHHLWADCD